MRDSVVLVGGGHAHLHLVRNAWRFQEEGVGVVLIDPGSFWYSGMATGLLSGGYEPAEDRIDLASLARRHGVTFRSARVKGIRRGRRRVLLDDGGEVPYELLSLNVGSETPPPAISDDGSLPTFPAKPIARLPELRKAIRSSVAAGGAMPAIGIVGGGATGSEIAANLLGLAEVMGLSPRVTVVSPGASLAPELPKGASRRLTGELMDRGLRFLQGQRVVAVEDGEVVTDRTRFPAELLVLAHGLQAGGLVGALGVPSSREGLRVNRFLQSVGDSRIFAAGDCADFQPRSLPKLGVFGVRQAPVLLANLRARLGNRSLQAYRPQRAWLSILNLGNGKGLAAWGSFWWLGRSSFLLKDQLDRRFLARYRP